MSEKRRLRGVAGIILFLLLGLVPALGLAQDGPGSAAGDKGLQQDRQARKKAAKYKDNQVIVRFRPEIKEENRSKIRDKHGVRKLKRHAFNKSELLEITDGSSVEDAVARLKANPNVLHVQPNFVYYADDLPDDPSFGELWGLHNLGQYIGGTRAPGAGVENVDIDAPEAWQITQGSSDIVVGIIDTAVDQDHVDLAGNIWTNPGEIPGDHIDNDHNGFIDDVHGWDFWSGMPCVFGPGMNLHGTHVAGTIAALANNTEGVVGVAPRVKIVPLTFLGPEGYGYTSDALDALNYAQMMGIRITNNSWGGGNYDQELHDAICGYNGVFVAAAGNGGDNADASPHYPAAYDCPNIVSVAALDNRGGLASFSTYGPTSVDVGAPGVDIFSTLPGNSYGFLSGTSMAAPHVTGIAALMMSMQPNLPGSQVRDMLISTAKPLDALQGLTVSGGMANAYNAVHLLELTSDPKDGAIEVPQDKTITVTFISDVAAGSNFDTITLSKGDQPVAMTKALVGRVLTLTPQALLEINSIYTVTLPNGAITNADGLDLRAYSFSFATHDTIAPLVVSSSPAAGATNVPGSQNLTVLLSETAKPGPNYALIALKKGSVPVPVQVGVDKQLLIIDPVYSLDRTSEYTVVIPAGAITDPSGNPLAAFSFSFTTAEDVTPPVFLSVTPLPYMREVPTTTDITVVFSEPILTDSHSAAIFVDCDGLRSPYALSTNGNTLTIHPLAPLQSSALCLAMVPAGSVKDATGNYLENAGGCYFWTRDDTSPTVTNINPPNGAVNASPIWGPVVTFSEDVFPGPDFAGITLKDDNNNAVPILVDYYADPYWQMTYRYKLSVTPLDTLASEKRYTLRFPAGAVTDGSAQHNAAAAFQSSFTVMKDITPPVASNGDPSHGSRDVPLNKVITVTFNEKIQPGSAFNAITLKAGSITVPATLAVSGTKLTITPSALNYNTTYTVTVPVAAVADLAGNSLATASSFWFMTPDTLPPRVVATTPTAAAKNVPVTTNLAISLSEDCRAGANFDAITLTNPAGNQVPLSSHFFEDEEGAINSYLIATPSVALQYNTAYTLTIPAGAVVDYAGNASLPYSYTFSTPYFVVASDPATGALGVPLDKTVTLTLNGNGTTGANFGSIVLKRGTTTVSATVALNGSTVTVRPAAALNPNTAYTLTVPEGAVVSSAGVPVAAYTINFRTVDPNVPRVTGTYPANGATGVPVNTAVNLYFSESTVPGGNFGAIALTDSLGNGVPVTSDYYCDDEGCLDFLLIVTPRSSLQPATRYTVTVPTGTVRDLAGNDNQPYSFGFTTQ